MIKSLAIVSLLSCGVGSQATPHFNNEQINETKHVEQRRLYENSTSTSQQDTDLNWEISQAGFENTQNVEWTYANIYPPGTTKLSRMWVNRKYEKYTQTNQGSMHTFLYENKEYERIYTDDENITGWYMPLITKYFDPGEGTYPHQNTFLYQTIFNPYQTIKTSYIDLSFEIDISAHMYINDIPTWPAVQNTIGIGIQYNITYLINAENNWSQYFDYTMTQNYSSNYDKVQEMTNSQNGYTYTRIDKTAQMITGTITNTASNEGTAQYSENENQRMFITQQIPIATNKVNYISIYIEPRIYLALENYDAETQTNTYTELTKQEAEQYYINFVNERSGTQNTSWENAQIIDKYNNTPSTPTNLNTDQVKWNWTINHLTILRAHGTWLPGITTEVIDIPGVMFTVLGMPWTFISTAFNLTLFPGTAYSVNIGSVMLMLLGVLIFVFLIKLIIFRK